VRLSRGIFRQDELPTLTFSCWKVGTNEPQACRDLRLDLYGEVQLAADRIVEALKRAFPTKMQRITVETFWMLTTNHVFRRNLTPHGPTMREFDLYPTVGLPGEPYNQLPPGMDPRFAPQPPGPPVLSAADQRKRDSNERRIHQQQLDIANLTQAQRRAQRTVGINECVQRSLHRLVNARLLRGAMALAGLTTAEAPVVVDPQAVDAMWLHHESDAAGPAGAPPDETAAWWSQPVRSTRRTWLGDKEYHARKACFPHMSRRTCWSQTALEAAVQGPGSVLRIAETHLLEDLRIAVADLP
jgi:hypothetical protein